MNSSEGKWRGNDRIGIIRALSKHANAVDNSLIYIRPVTTDEQDTCMVTMVLAVERCTSLWFTVR